MEKWQLINLATQFATADASIETRVPYASASDRGDIDFVLYEVSTNRLVVGMLKAFILPDSVEEVMHANRELEKGVRQVERARRWLDGMPFTRWRVVLRVPLGDTPPEVRYVVIGNGSSEATG